MKKLATSLLMLTGLLASGTRALAEPVDCSQSDGQVLRTAENEGYYCQEPSSLDPCYKRSWEQGRRRFISEVKSGNISGDNSAELKNLMEEVKAALFKRTALPDQCRFGNACEQLACRVLANPKVRRVRPSEPGLTSDEVKTETPALRGFSPLSSKK